jgi:hypothetical protein
MAKDAVPAVCTGLLERFLLPLVVGGELRPGRPIGSRIALALGEHAGAADTEKLSWLLLARTRLARRLVPIDRIDGVCPEEWALGAVLHDLVQSTHPDLGGLFRGKLPRRVLELCEATLDRVPPARSAKDALLRHTLFARTLEIARTDTKISWWVGSRTFLGTEVPARLAAWPAVRRVRIEKTPRPLVDLPSSGGRVDGDAFARVLRRFLERTPLTDLATSARPVPEFQWTEGTLTLIATRGGRTLALRALDLAESREGLETALGRATLELAKRKARTSLRLAVTLLGERALALAEQRLASRETALPQGGASPEATAAQAMGAWAAMRIIATQGDAFREAERAGLLAALGPAARNPVVQPIEALLEAPDTQREPRSAGS